jgi:TonB-linked SusC/RagA family outer membrane protein
MKKRLLLMLALFMVSMQIVLAQAGSIRGKVFDDKGEPIAGATIRVKGTNRGTVTDPNGNFKVNAEEGTTLLISAIGMKPTEKPAEDGMNVKMVADSRTLRETVVTALGQKKERRALGYSVSEVKSDAIQKSGEQNAIQALAAKAPGVQVTSSAGTPGASSKILLRGNTTFTGNNQPLLVVDGVPIDNGTSQPLPGDYPFNENLTGVNESNRGLDINPDDIESVSILKGPAAASLYGARGGNGAIVITTKKGRKRKGIGITYNGNVEVSRVNKLPELQNTYAQGNGGVFSTYNPGPDGIVNTLDDELGTPNSWGPRIDTSAGLNAYDPYDFFQDGRAYNHSLSIDGGGDNSTFRLSMGNTRSTGIIPNSKLNRTTLNLFGESTLTPWLRVGANANYTKTKGTRVQNGSNLAGIMLTLLRTPASYDLSNWYDETKEQPNLYFGIYDNPYFTAFRNPYEDVTNRIFGNIYGTANILHNLTFTLKSGLDNYTTNTRQIYDLLSFGNDNGDGLGQVNRSTNTYTQSYTDAILKYNNMFADDKIDFSAALGYNNWDQRTEFRFMRGRNLALPNLYSFNNASELYTSNLDSRIQTNAVFADVNFGFENMLYFNLAGRNEWSTTFGKGGKSFFYPKADVSFVFNELFKDFKHMNIGKIRFAYAQAGVSPLAYSDRNYYSAPIFTDGFTNGNSFPYNGQAGFGAADTYNPGSLDPEIVTGREAGLELRFLKNRFGLEFTYYNQITNNILLVRPAPPSIGYNSIYDNSGRLQNRGIELMVDLGWVKTKNISWNTQVNFTRNRSEVLALANGVDELSIETGFSGIGSYAIVGQPYGVFYGTRWQRDPSSGQILIGENGRPLVDAITGKIGDPNPDFLMGISNTLNIHNFSFSFLLDIRQGGDIWNGTYSRLNRIGRTEESADRERTYVVPGIFAPGTTKAGQSNDVPISALQYYSIYQGDGAGSAAENAIQDGSWVRLRSVNLGYRFNIAKQNPAIQYIDLYVTGRNLWLRTKYKGVDPETSLTGAGSNINGYDYFNNPGSKSILFGIRVGL